MNALRLGLGTAAVAAVMTLTGCGGDSTNNASGTATPGNGDAFQNCLREQGIEMPDRGQRPSGAPPSGAPNGAPGGGGPGGPGGGMPSMSAEQQKAFQACASLRPSGMPGGGGPNVQALTAFFDCMTKNGATVDQNTRPDQLNTADPKIAKALRTCQALLPQRTPTPSAS